MVQGDNITLAYRDFRSSDMCMNINAGNFWSNIQTWQSLCCAYMCKVRSKKVVHNEPESPYSTLLVSGLQQ